MNYDFQSFLLVLLATSINQQGQSSSTILRKSFDLALKTHSDASYAMKCSTLGYSTQQEPSARSTVHHIIYCYVRETRIGEVVISIVIPMKREHMGVYHVQEAVDTH